MIARVLYQDWQMECCGVPFDIGDDITLDVLPFTADLGDEGAGITWIEEHHQTSTADSSQLVPLGGRVVRIRALWQRFEASENDSRLLVPVDGDVVAVELTSAGREPVENPTDDPARRFIGFDVGIER